MIFKRIFDIVFSFLGLLLLLPLFLIFAVFILADNFGSIFFLQTRVGKNNIDFKLFKFRTMYLDSEKKGFLTIGNSDSRITKFGHFLRKFKFDELPQLINVFKGDMSFVGPRPEVRKYVDLYNQKQLHVLEVKPGITDYASIIYRNENDILSKSANPEQTYINEILPRKLALNAKYIETRSFGKDIMIIFKTVQKVFI